MDLEMLLRGASYAILFLLVLTLPLQFSRIRRGWHVVVPGEDAAERSLTERITREIVRHIGGRWSEVAGRGPAVALLLRRAGHREPNVAQFFTVRVGAAFGLGVLGLAAGLMSGSLVQTGALFVGAGLVGYMLPQMLVSRQARARLQRARNEIPAWLANYAVIMSSGLTPTTTLSELSRSSEGVLYAEGRIAAREIEVGKTYREAMTGMAERIGSDEITSILRMLVDVSENNHVFRNALLAEARNMQQAVESDITKRMADNVTFGLAVMVLCAMPLLFYVILVPYGLRLLQLFSGSR